MPRKPSFVPSSAAARQQQVPTRSLHIAVQGCCHGELNKIYDACRKHEENWGKKIDFLICCGDFQSIRCEGDLDSMAVPIKYRTMGDFHEYCEGTTDADGGDHNSSGADSKKKMAPYLTIFIGGNHEASNVLFQNYYGGYIAPNVYYVGHAGVIDVMGLRLAGLSGIYKSFDVNKPYPIPPYDDRSVRSAYHVRSYEVEKLSLFGALLARERKALAAAATTNAAAAPTVAEEGSTTAESTTGPSSTGGSSAAASAADVRPIDIILSHDWPVGITKYGDEAQLLRYKPYFGPDIEKGELGNPMTMGLLTELQPRYWCSAHLHCSFNASVTHSETSRTQFVALDKCTKDKSFLDFIDITVPVPTAAATDGGEAADLITIPALWQEVLRVAQPSLERSHRVNDLRMDSGVSASTVQLQSPLPPPIPVGFSTNVAVALARGQSGAKRPRTDASLSGAVEAAVSSAAVVPVAPSVAPPVAAPAAAAPAAAAATDLGGDDWLIEG